MTQWNELSTMTQCCVLYVSGDCKLHSPTLSIGLTAVLLSHCEEAVEALEKSESVGRRILRSALAADERGSAKTRVLNRLQELASVPSTLCITVSQHSSCSGYRFAHSFDSKSLCAITLEA